MDTAVAATHAWVAGASLLKLDPGSVLIGNGLGFARPPSMRSYYLQLPALRYPAACAADSESKVIWFFADT